MRVVCVGGGPGGLFFAALVKRADPSIEVIVYERNRPDDTFGFGVVFSDATLATLAAADDILANRLSTRGEYWDRISVRLKGERVECGGNGMAAIMRKELLSLLTERAIEAGVDIRWQSEVPSLAEVQGADLIVASDGANSRIRNEMAAVFKPRIETATAKFIWFGTTYRFDGLTFLFEHGPHGTFAVHGYPISSTLGTFIVETDEPSWRRAGLDEFQASQPSGASDMKSKAYIEELFAGQIDGHELVVNNSRWSNFSTVRNERWSNGNVVLVGDAAHTAHFSVGSGTKMAMEDAASLATHVLAHPSDMAYALREYEAERRPQVERIQNSAGPSLSWWEHFGSYYESRPPVQFAFHFLTRSISHDRIKTRDPEFVASVHDWWECQRVSSALQPNETSLDGIGAVLRTVTVRSGPGDHLVADFAGRSEVPLFWQMPIDLADGPWGLLVSLDVDVEVNIEPLKFSSSHPPSFIAIDGGSPQERVSAADAIGRSSKLPVMVIDDEPSEDRVLTLLLSGRASLIGVSEVVSA